MFSIKTERLLITEFAPGMAQAVHENSLDEDNRRFVPDEVFETVKDAAEAIDYLMDKGIAVLVTDHHEQAVPVRHDCLVVGEKSLAFGRRMAKCYRYLHDKKKEAVMSKQLLRSGTSIGANIQEAQCVITKNDFLNKMYIALKECAESMYWIELLFRTDYLTKSQYDSILSDCHELHSLLSSITKTTRENIKS